MTLITNTTSDGVFPPSTVPIIRSATTGAKINNTKKHTIPIALNNLFAILKAFSFSL